MARRDIAAPRKMLCVDDDTYLTDLLQYALGRDGHTVSVAADGATALWMVRTDPPDVVLLDLQLPDINGFTLCDQLRQLGNMPIIILTARYTDADMVKGFQHGAADYVTKPFSMRILSCRIEAVLRQAAGVHEQADSRKRHYKLDLGVFDAEQYVVRCGDWRIKLTPIQGKILQLLLDNEGRVISSEQIMTRIWHYDAESDGSVVKTHISTLRKRLVDVLGTDDLIRTIAGLGYMLRQSS